MVFRARLAAERTRPADTKGVDVTCCGRNAGLRVSELSAQSPGRPHSVTSTWHRFSGSFSDSHRFCTLPKCSSLCVLLIFGLQGDILTVIRRLDEHWIEAKLGEKVGICPLQFTEVSSSYSFICPTLFEGGFVAFSV